MGERRDAFRVLVGKPEGRNHLKNPGIDGRIILKCIIERLGGSIDWIDLAQVTDSCEYGDEPWDSIKCGEFFE
jgi:hypothetical protein